MDANPVSRGRMSNSCGLGKAERVFFVVVFCFATEPFIHEVCLSYGPLIHKRLSEQEGEKTTLIQHLCNKIENSLGSSFATPQKNRIPEH